MEWRTHEWDTTKKIFKCCARLWWISWQFILLQILPSSHLNSQSSHLNGRLLLWVACVWLGSYSECSSTCTRHTWMGVYCYEKVSILNLCPSKSKLKSQSTFFAMMTFDFKCQNVQTSFFTNDSNTHTHKHTHARMHARTHAHTHEHTHTDRQTQKRTRPQL